MLLGYFREELPLSVGAAGVSEQGARHVEPENEGDREESNLGVETEQDSAMSKAMSPLVFSVT